MQNDSKDTTTSNLLQIGICSEHHGRKLQLSTDMNDGHLQLSKKYGLKFQISVNKKYPESDLL